MYTWKELSSTQEKLEVIRNFKGYATEGKPKNWLVIIDLRPYVHLDEWRLSSRREQMLVAHLYNQMQFILHEILLPHLLKVKPE